MLRTAPSGTSTSRPSAPTEGLRRALVGARQKHPLVFFIGRRLVALVLLGVGVTAIAFVLTHLVPGDPAEANLGPDISRAVRTGQARAASVRHLPGQAPPG